LLGVKLSQTEHWSSAICKL